MAASRPCQAVQGSEQRRDSTKAWSSVEDCGKLSILCDTATGFPLTFFSAYDSYRDKPQLFAVTTGYMAMGLFPLPIVVFFSAGLGDPARPAELLGPGALLRVGDVLEISNIPRPA